MKTQCSFANGEVAPEFYTRDNINGLSHLENMDVLAGGGLTRRAGLASIGTLPGNARLIPFSVDAESDYLLALTDGRILVFQNNELVQNMFSPWGTSDLPNIQYAQRFGTMIFVHPNFQPRILKQQGSVLELSTFSFARNDDMSVNMPFMHFDDADGVTITVSTHSSGNNYATFTTNQEFWSDAYVENTLQLLGHQWIITEYVSPTVVVAYTNGTYSVPSAPVSDWAEAAFGTARGWPCSITFHQDRLIFGGSPSYPSGVWMSQVGRHNNFNIGTGLDDEAIFITLLSRQRQQICTVVSSDNLQILTSVAEWAISSKPLTPSNVDIKQHTSVGSVASRFLPPQKVEGATVFISRNMSEIRELALDELGEHYNATDLCTMAKHLMKTPTDIAYNADARQLFVVMNDGEMAVLNYNSGVGIAAWSRYKTGGEFKSVAVLDGVTYVVVLRENNYSLERFSRDAMCDAGAHPFAFRASALPVRASNHNARSLRVRKISARVINTKSMQINGVRVALPNDAIADAAPGFSGDVSINLLGTMHDGVRPPWSIHGTDALPITIMSVTIHGYYQV